MTPVFTAGRTLSRVLLVVSDVDLARDIQRDLMAFGCCIVEIAGDGAEAQKRCLRLAPDLVLIDQRLFGHDASVAAELAARVSAPVVYLCDAGSSLPAAAFAHGVGYVDKPVTRHGLARAIGFALHRYQVEAALRASLAAQQSSALERPAGQREPAAPSRLSTELLGSMAHELRAPLQGVMGFATFLRDGKAGSVSETQQQYLDHIASGANHVLQVVNDVLDLTATDSDTLHVRTQPVDPEQAAREVLQVLQVIAIRKRLEVTVQVDEQLGHVVSDATKIKQVLYNFVSNALKFTPSGGRISVSLRREGPDAFCIEVADTGVGIPPEALATLFEHAARGPTASNGLGLFLTKRIVDALGGTLSVENRPAGGSVFSAHLPIAPSVADRRAQDILLPDDP